MNIKDLIKDNAVHFLRYRKGYFYYKIGQWEGSENFVDYQFPVPLSDIGDATLNNSDKAITYMRYINAAIKDGTLVKV